MLDKYLTSCLSYYKIVVKHFFSARFECPVSPNSLVSSQWPPNCWWLILGDPGYYVRHGDTPEGT